jgi:hypothetical protein
MQYIGLFISYFYRLRCAYSGYYVTIELARYFCGGNSSPYLSLVPWEFYCVASEQFVFILSSWRHRHPGLLPAPDSAHTKCMVLSTSLRLWCVISSLVSYLLCNNVISSLVSRVSCTGCCKFMSCVQLWQHYSVQKKGHGFEVRYNGLITNSLSFATKTCRNTSVSFACLCVSLSACNNLTTAEQVYEYLHSFPRVSRVTRWIFNAANIFRTQVVKTILTHIFSA